jgi:hypothetical protein
MNKYKQSFNEIVNNGSYDDDDATRCTMFGAIHDLCHEHFQHSDVCQ